MKAAKEKMFWLKLVAVSLLFCAPTIALGLDVLTPQNCAELSAEYGQTDSEESAFGPAIHAEKYDLSWRVASGSSVAPKIGVNQVPVTGAAKRSWPRISAVAPDWATKGAHIHVNGVELAVRPGAGGSVVFKPAFSSTNSTALKNASKAATDALGDIGFRQRLHNAAVRAIQNIPKDSGKAAELRFLIDALQKLGV